VKPQSGEMSFLDHLEELRWRIVKIALAVAICAVPCGIFWKRIFDIVMIYPLRFANPKPQLIFTSPTESVLLSFKIALGAGVIVAIPVVFYQIWRFVAPGLFPKEKRIVLPTVFASSIAFLCGISFCYFVLPFLLRILTAYAGTRLNPFFKIDEYFSFLLKLSLAFGVVFEMPVISFVLSRLGILTPKVLIRHSRIAIVIIAVIAAVLTPPDIFSMMMLAVPLLALYGLSILVAYFARRKQ
jgi:sec-independent protein translocase protein TatC